MRNALKGHVDLLLLSALEDDPAHGYELVETLRERSEGAFDLAEGTVYPALYRLERQGLLESQRAVVDRRQRRMYTITNKGKAALGEGAKKWRAFARGVSAVLETT